MKYEIQKDKLDKAIYKYIVDLFENNDRGELNYTYFDDDGTESDCQITFYFGDYGDDDIAFVWETEEIYEYWNDRTGSNNGCEECPKITIVEDLTETLDGLFNNMWRPIFKKWVKNNFDLEPKTII